MKLLGGGDSGNTSAGGVDVGESAGIWSVGGCRGRRGGQDGGSGCRGDDVGAGGTGSDDGRGSGSDGDGGDGLGGVEVKVVGFLKVEL